MERLEALRDLVERLCGTDLTLAEAKSLRIQVLVLLERCDLSTETDFSASSPSMSRTDTTGQDHQSPVSVLEAFRSAEAC